MEDFIAAKSRYQWSELSPHISTRFHRITLVNKAKTERLTIDMDLVWDNVVTGESKTFPELVIVELINTLNAPELSGGKQYITSVRTQIGTTWRLTEKNSLDFYYRFTYGYEKDVNVRAKKQTIELTNETGYQHAVGITYRFDW